MCSVWEFLFLGGWQEEAHSVTFWAKETPVCVHTYRSLCLIERPRGQHSGMPGQLLFRSSHVPKLPSGLDCYCDSLHLFEASRLTDVIHPLHTHTTLCVGLKKKEKRKRSQETGGESEAFVSDLKPGDFSNLLQSMSHVNFSLGTCHRLRRNRNEQGKPFLYIVRNYKLISNK